MNDKILQALSFDNQQLIYVMPELFLLSSIMVILLIHLFSASAFSRTIYYLSQLSLLITAILSWRLLDQGTVIIFSDSFILDYLSGVLKIAIYLFSMVVLVYSRHYLSQHNLLKGEYFVLFLLAIFGMMVLVSGYSLLTMYIGLEILTISFYTLIAFATHRLQATEAALKFFVLAAIASAILLYGMSMIYGISGSINIGEIAQFTANTSQLAARELLVLNFGLVFIVIGLAFKFGAVPFHMWVPDVYQGAPTSVTLFLSTAPKIASLVMLIRLLVEALGGLVAYWHDIILFMSIASIALGSLVAIAQTNLKRMLAYSTISHVGFILLGFGTGVFESYSAAIFYTLSYVLMSLLAFGLMIAFNSKNFEADNIIHYKGLAKSHPWYALMMLMVMLSMAGIPPFIGFYAKLFILQELVGQGYVWLAIIAVVFAVISAYYYLNVCRMMYFVTQDKDKPTLTLTARIDMRLILGFNALLILIFGLYPDYFIGLSQSLI